MKRYQLSFALTEFLLVILFVLSLTLLSGCELKIKSHSVEEIKSELSYFKDDYGNCFASVGSMTSHGFVSTSITSIPCERMPQ